MVFHTHMQGTNYHCRLFHFITKACLSIVYMKRGVCSHSSEPSIQPPIIHTSIQTSLQSNNVKIISNTMSKFNRIKAQHTHSPAPQSPTQSQHNQSLGNEIAAIGMSRINGCVLSSSSESRSGREPELEPELEPCVYLRQLVVY
jgi:hypothetical protein